MTTTRTKRWNGHIETLKADYLKEVIVQMDAYGDRVQLALSGPGQRPNYQVINSADKKMAFDSNHHLLSGAEEIFTPGNVTSIYTLEQVKTIANGGGVRVATGRVARASSGAARPARATRTAAAQAQDLIDAEKYAYFKDHRDMLPATIGEHSAQITALMKTGKSAEDAFNEVLTQYY